MKPEIGRVRSIIYPKKTLPLRTGNAFLFVCFNAALHQRIQLRQIQKKKLSREVLGRATRTLSLFFFFFGGGGLGTGNVGVNNSTFVICSGNGVAGCIASVGGWMGGWMAVPEVAVVVVIARGRVDVEVDVAGVAVAVEVEVKVPVAIV